MKKIKLANKLALNKRTVAQLNQAQMHGLKGGFTFGLSLGEVCRWSDRQELGDDKDACQKDFDKAHGPKFR